MTAPLPRRPEDITGPWLAAALARRGMVAPGTTLDVDATVVGADRGFTGVIARVAWRSDDARGAFIAKLPDAAGPNFERCAREVRFYETLAPGVSVAVPQAWFAEADAGSQTVVLLLEEVAGSGGDAETGCTVDEAAPIVDAMAGMHARWWRSAALEDHDWLPHWGQGTAGHDTPHRRAVERFRRRIEPFFGWYAEDAAPGLRAFVDSLAETGETLYAKLAELPATLIHADLHLDNIMFGPGGDVTVIDWQSVSRGPGVRDLVLFLAGSLRGQDGRDAFPRLVERYAETLARHGVPAADLAGIDEAVRLSLLRCLAGFISGYGGRPPETMTPREARMVRRAAGAESLGGMVMGLCHGQAKPGRDRI